MSTHFKKMGKYGSARIARQKFWRRLRFYGILSGAVLIFIFIAYIFIGSPLLKIKTFSVKGIDPSYHNAIISALALQVVSQPLGGLLGSDNYLAWDTDLSYATPQVSSVKINKNLFTHSLAITVTARARYAVWCLKTASEDEVPFCYWVDEAGFTFEPAPLTEGQLLLTIHDDAANISLGDAVLEPDQFTIVKKILSAVLDQRLGVRLIKLNRSLQEVHITTLKNTRLMMSLRFDPEPTAIPAIIKFSQDPGLDKLEYLNLTVENRAFVKYK